MANPVLGNALTTNQTDGSATAKEVQTIQNSGNDDLIFYFGSDSTDPFMAGSLAADVQTGLNNLDSIKAIGGLTASYSGNTWTFTFNSNGNQPAITARIVTLKGDARSDRDGRFDQPAGSSGIQERQQPITNWYSPLMV